MTIKELKKEFKIRNSASKAAENLMTIPFIICIIVAIFTFNITFFFIGIIFAIIQSILYFNNKQKWKVFLLENKDKLRDEERAKIKM